MVAINVTPWRCDALILTDHDSDQIRLQDLSQSDAIRQANAFLAATRTPGTAGTREMIKVLAWLWDSVTGPILEHLGHYQHRQYGRWPRVWWSPTGPLTVLPLHAAGHHTGRSSTTNVLDRVVSSYTPTVRMLTRAHHNVPDDHRSALVVGINNAPGHPPLGFAVDEARAVNALLDAPTPPLIDTQATIARVRAGVEHAAWAHFACHGSPAPDPAESHLVLHDGPLAVREIANLDLPHARLAYLSACTTAFGGTTLLDESIHIASAFQVAGYPHVIATLWPITDDHAPHIAHDFYTHLRNGEDPAHAAHHAVRSLQNQVPEHPYLWAPYIHLGP